MEGDSSKRNGAIVSIVTWFLLVVSTLGILARLATRWAVSHKLGGDDCFIILSLICSIGSGIAVSLQAVNGLGRNLDTLSPSEIDIFSKVRSLVVDESAMLMESQSNFATGFLYVVTLCIAKFSIVMWCATISPLKKHEQFAGGVSGFIISGSFICITAIADQCRLPGPSPVHGCSDRTGIFEFAASLNIVSDLALIILPLYIIKDLQMTPKTKILILSGFGTRVVDIVATCFQIKYTSGFGSSNFTYDLWPWVIISQVIQCLTIICSCIPYLKPFLESFSSGMYSGDEVLLHGLPGSAYAVSKGAGETQELGRSGQRLPSRLPGERRLDTEVGPDNVECPEVMHAR
ncbi:hypothetical protein MMC30_006931 [Trapelia coarctata]|nr:hypothetical protein [Trapelia coarctata]